MREALSNRIGSAVDELHLHNEVLSVKYVDMFNLYLVSPQSSSQVIVSAMMNVFDPFTIFDESFMQAPMATRPRGLLGGTYPAHSHVDIYENDNTYWLISGLSPDLNLLIETAL